MRFCMSHASSSPCYFFRLFLCYLFSSLQSACYFEGVESAKGKLQNVCNQGCAKLQVRLRIDNFLNFQKILNVSRRVLEGKSKENDHFVRKNHSSSVISLLISCYSLSLSLLSLCKIPLAFFCFVTSQFFALNFVNFYFWYAPSEVHSQFLLSE